MHSEKPSDTAVPIKDVTLGQLLGAHQMMLEICLPLFTRLLNCPKGEAREHLGRCLYVDFDKRTFTYWPGSESEIDPNEFARIMWKRT